MASVTAVGGGWGSWGFFCEAPPDEPIQMWKGERDRKDDGTLILPELIPLEIIGTPHAPPHAKGLYENIRRVDVFFREIFQAYIFQSTFDNPDRLMRGHVECPSIFNNAIWRREAVHCGIVVDETLYYPAGDDLTIVAHELGHAIISYTSRFKHQGQSGALSESVADIFGVMTKHYHRGIEVNEATDWLVGDGLFKIADIHTSTVALRSLKEPEKVYHPYLKKPVLSPGSMAGYDYELATHSGREHDYGGVHTHCGIPSRAFVLAAEGIRGPSYGIPGRIWYEALEKAGPDEDFVGFAKLTIGTARLLYSEGISSIVASAWHTVGVI